MQRQQHISYVAQRRAAQAAFAETTVRIAAKLADRQVVAREQHLVQRVVAVDADFDRVDFFVVNLFEQSQYFAFAGRDLFGLRLHIARQRFQLFALILERFAHQRLQTRIQGALVVQREAF